jgi:hypothetical protein
MDFWMVGANSHQIVTFPAPVSQSGESIHDGLMKTGSHAAPIKRRIRLKPFAKRSHDRPLVSDPSTLQSGLLDEPHDRSSKVTDELSMAEIRRRPIGDRSQQCLGSANDGPILLAKSGKKARKFVVGWRN